MANDDIEFSFSYLALKMLGKNLYSNPWAAISELVANGLDAQSSEVFLYIDVSEPENSAIEIFDNGVGMDENDRSSAAIATAEV